MKILVAIVALAIAVPAAAQQLFDHTIPPGANFDKAEFRLWVPPGLARVRAVLVLVPGSNGDGRPMAEDAFWQTFATRQRLAIVACRFTDKPHEQSFIEDYVKVSDGSGQALIDAVTALAKAPNHPE